jgi:hypothetical protein
MKTSRTMIKISRHEAGYISTPTMFEPLFVHTHSSCVHKIDCLSIHEGEPRSGICNSTTGLFQNSSSERVFEKNVKV